MFKDVTAAAKDILEAALKLDSQQRAALVDELSTSLYPIDLGSEWESEIQARMAEVDSGSVKTVPGEAVFARLESRFGGK